VVIIPIIIFIVWLGIYPKPFLDKTEASVEQVIRTVESGTKIRWTNIDDMKSNELPVLTISEDK